jgi:thiosulfate/3-mercaptopyruvate sulfurtransferase
MFDQKGVRSLLHSARRYHPTLIAVMKAALRSSQKPMAPARLVRQMLTNLWVAALILLIVFPWRSRAETAKNSAKKHHSEWLVETDWLKAHLNDRSVIIADTRSEKEYLQGHISGAILFDVSDLNPRTAESGLPALHEELARKFAALGIQGAEQVVFYDESMGTKAPKALWLLTYSGYRWGRVLHGGLGAWQKAGLPLSSEKVARTPQTFRVSANPNVLATSDYVAKRLRNTTAIILDVRTREEYSGKNGSKHCARNGRIPGAIWLEWTELLEGPLTYRQVADLQKRLSQAGVSPDKEVITYCHLGNRSSNTYLALQLLGYPKVKNYVGSWHEWASRLDLPLEKDE